MIGVTLATLSSPASAASAFLRPGQRLNPGQALNTGTGCTLNDQTDGNVVEYCNGAAVFDTRTYGYSGVFLAMQTDGNLVAYTGSGVAKWSTGTNGFSVAYLALQDDRNLVVYETSGRALWASSWRQNIAGSKAYAQIRFPLYGWSSSQWSCLDNLWTAESGWRWNATNASSGAYGIPQSLPANKMAANGTDWQVSGLTQIQWGEDYIRGRYSTPCGAWSFWQSHHYY